MRKPNYNQDRLQRERDKAAKAQAKEQKKLDQREAKNAARPDAEPAEDSTDER
ncbi:hypothetical protein VQH23_24785 [Pararoseomonas sp. SCSIO 73927]|uniref:hypothetical protein n=1 Tax=Pararoseomonas sp. SCSIO 73927 TaxID=3114537 RepID=UPI0030CBDFC5